jgi:hypothetical protein
MGIDPNPWDATQRNHTAGHTPPAAAAAPLETERKTEGTGGGDVEGAGSKAGRFNLKMETPWNKVGFLEEPAS